MEEPTDEMLHAIMEKVAVAARESSARAENAKRRMMAETIAKIGRNRTAALWTSNVVQHEEMTDGEETWNSK